MYTVHTIKLPAILTFVIFNDYSSVNGTPVMTPISTVDWITSAKENLYQTQMYTLSFTMGMLNVTPVSPGDKKTGKCIPMSSAPHVRRFTKPSLKTAIAFYRVHNSYSIINPGCTVTHKCN